jgi:hypothetical protein
MYITNISVCERVEDWSLEVVIEHVVMTLPRDGRRANLSGS